MVRHRLDGRSLTQDWIGFHGRLDPKFSFRFQRFFWNIGSSLLYVPMYLHGTAHAENNVLQGQFLRREILLQIFSKWEILPPGRAFPDFFGQDLSGLTPVQVIRFVKILGQRGMSFELLAPVKKIAVSGQLPANKSIAQALGNIDHFRVEIPDPLHFIVHISGPGLDDLG